MVPACFEVDDPELFFVLTGARWVEHTGVQLVLGACMVMMVAWYWTFWFLELRGEV